MIALRAGSTSWLLAHEIRLSWRTTFNRRKAKGDSSAGVGRAPVIMLCIMAFVALVAGIPLGLAMSRVEVALSPVLVVTIAGVTLILFTLMLSQTMSAATTAFYERADLDLLLSSPLQPEKTLAVRVMAIAGNAVLLFVLLPTPLLLPVALIGHPAWLSTYVVLGSLALLASVAGLWLAMGLFALIGPRRTKTVAQLMAALIGAVIFLASQSYSLFGRDRSASLWGGLRDWAEGRDVVGSLVSWPARAALGEPLALVALAVVSLLVFAVTSRTLGRRFAMNASSAVGADADPRRAARPDTAGRFGDRPFAALVRKEMRLLFRDPVILSQALLQVFYLLPVAFILLRNANENATAFVAVGAGAMVFLAGQLGGTLGWITISAEDSPELLACAPIAPGRIGWAKVCAVLIPIAGVLVIPLAGLIVLSPWAGVVSAVGCLLAAASSGLIEYWRQRPGKRRDFRRQRGSAVLVTMVEVFIGLFYGAATGLLVVFQIWALIPLALALLAVFAMKPWGART